MKMGHFAVNNKDCINYSDFNTTDLSEYKMPAVQFNEQFTFFKTNTEYFSRTEYHEEFENYQAAKEI